MVDFTNLTSPIQPLTHARIGWHCYTATILSQSSAPTGYLADNAFNGTTYDRYKPTSSPAEIVLDLLAAKDVDYIATLTKNVTSIQILRSSDNITYTSIATLSSTDASNMILFDNVTYRYYKIIFTGTNIEVINIKLGLSLEMQRAIYSGHSPLALSRIHAIRPNVSETGQFLGATVRRKGLKGQFSWNNLQATWYRNNFDVFAQSIPQANPFFIAWRPQSFPNDCNYVWAMGDVTPTNTGTLDFMSVSIDVEAYIE